LYYLFINVLKLYKIIPEYCIDLTPEYLISLNSKIIETLSLKNRGDLQAINRLINDLRKMMPEPKCDLHSLRIGQSFESFTKLIENNAECAWLLPPPSNGILCRPELGQNYFGSQLIEWSCLLARKVSDDDTILEKTKYLFITWDLSNISGWNPILLGDLKEMLIELGNKTINPDGLHVHRVIIVNWDEISPDGTYQDCFKKIWEAFFERYVGNDKPNYKISFINSSAVSNIPNKRYDDIKKAFFDIALFSFCSNVRDRAFNGMILPAPQSQDTFKEYAALQYSLMDGDANFLELYLVKGSAAAGWNYDMGDKLIAKRRAEALEIWNQLKNRGRIDNLIKEKTGFEFSELPIT